MAVLKTLESGTVVPLVKVPTASMAVSPQFGVLGSVIKLDGRGSSDPDGLSLSYTWSFVSTPIGSEVGREGFRNLDPDSGLVSFSPDVVGEYIVGLVVSNGSYESSQVTSSTNIRAILVPHARGLIPDGKWVWSYIRDVWSQVEGKELFETLWSALIQITGSEMLKLYQTDFNKSIRDIQDLYQRRWLSYDPKLALDQSELSFYIGNHCAGTDALSGPLTLGAFGVILSSTEIIIIQGSVTPNASGLTILFSLDSSNAKSYTISGLNTAKNGYRLSSSVPSPLADKIHSNIQFFFNINSTEWTSDPSGSHDYALAFSTSGSPLDQLLPLFFQENSFNNDNILVGDVIHYPAGPNAGFYRVISKSGPNLTVHKAPPSFSNLTTSVTYQANVYRPVRLEVSQPAQLTTNTIAVPHQTGANDLSKLAPDRVLVVGGRGYTILRTVVDSDQAIPLTLVTVDEEKVPAGLESQTWRAPHTLKSSSQNFEELGVSPGDMLLIDVVRQDFQSSVEVVAQVVGVDGDRLGFVLTDETLTAGVIPPIPNKTYVALGDGFRIPTVEISDGGQVELTSLAKDIETELNSGIFQSQYWNTELTPDSDIKVQNLPFRLTPKAVFRNRLIPVESTLRSVPMLQEFIQQPDLIDRDGSFIQLHNGREYPLKNKPAVLMENLDYLIDGQLAFNGELTFKSGSKDIIADDGDFIDRGIIPGDEFIIDAPITLAGTYLIQAITGRHKLRLIKDVPSYFQNNAIVTAKVRIRRKKKGQFLRLTPGLFTAKSPSPSRLWGEVSLFDNSESVENNFGILVGLTRSDLDKISTDLNYRQSVAGLMFAFTRGASVDKVRLGAQILLGLPFAEHRGIIRSIENDYRLDLKGNPIFGRLLVEDINSSDTPIGTLRVYIYPVEEASANLAGIEENPATKKAYQIGDTVEIFAPLSKGVEVIDYVSSPLGDFFSAQTKIQQFHSIRVRINDNIFTLDEISLVSQFLRKITPSYIASILSIASEFVDLLSVIDSSTIRMGNINIVDDASFSIPPSLMLNSINSDGIPQTFLDGTVYWVRRTGLDLVTTNDSLVTTSASGGFLDPKTGESFEAPLCKTSDKIWIRSGINEGLYSLSAITDTTATIGDGPAQGFRAASSQFFSIIRPLSSTLRTGSVTFTNGSDIVTTNTGGLRTDGIAPGDVLASTKAFKVVAVQESSSGSGIWNKLKITPTPTFSGSDSYSLFRPSLIEGIYPPGASNFFISSTGANTFTLNSLEFDALAESGDEIVGASGSILDQSFFLVDPVTRYVTPAIPSGSYFVKLRKSKRPTSAFSLGHRIFFDPTDIIEIRLSDTDATISTTNGAATATFSSHNPIDLGIKVGDILVPTSGSDALKQFYIKSLTSTTCDVTTNFTNTGSVAWYILRSH